MINIETLDWNLEGPISLKHVTRQDKNGNIFRPKYHGQPEKSVKLNEIMH